MIRKLNYTGRKKIKRGNVRVDILRDAGGRRYFNASVSLDDLGLPPERMFMSKPITVWLTAGLISEPSATGGRPKTDI